MAETPDIVYGRLQESRDITAYTLDRYLNEVKWLLTDNRYRQVSQGFTDVNVFLRSVDFSGFNLKEMRPELARMIKELQPEASNRAIASALGVSEFTIRNDQKPTINHALDIQKNNDVDDWTAINHAPDKAVLQRYPELAQVGIPPRYALKIAETLDQLPAPVRAQKRAAIRAREPGILAELAGLPPMPTPDQEDQHAQQKAYWHQACREIDALLRRVSPHKDFAEDVIAAWSLRTQKQQLNAMKHLVHTLEPIIDTLQRLIAERTAADARS